MTTAKQRRRSRAPTRRRGQGLLEFALVVPIFMVLFIGAIDFGMAFHVKVILENSAREGANYLVYNKAAASASGFAATISAVQTEGQGSGITIDSGNIVVHCYNGASVDDTCPSGSTVSVVAGYNMSLPVEIIFHGPLHLTNEARMLVP